MAHITDDRVLESTTTTGTSALTLAGALAGYTTFASVMTSPSDTCWYAAWAVDANGNATGAYEEGLGTYSAASTLTRTTVLKSSNANALVSFAAGTKYVAIAALASRVVQLNSELTANLPAVAVSAVSAAAADTLKVFARKVAGRMTLKYVGPSGVDQVVQDKISENGQVLYLPNNGTAVGLNLGLAWTSGGTVSHPTPSSTAPAIYNQQKRTRWANVVTTTNQVLGLRTATAEKRFWRGNAAGLGGFNFHARFAIGLWPAATVRLFVGLNDSNAGWVISDTLTGNGCGLWHDTTEAATVLNFVTRDGTTATKAAITLGSALAAGQCYDFWMWSAPNGSAIGYKLVDLATGVVRVDTTTTTTIPLATAFLGPELAMSNGTANITVTTVAFELAGHSVQSDN
jgi:hypothetical protein